MARWVFVDHHVSHAVAGFHDSPFDSALVFSYDGGGNDGNTRLFYAAAGQLLSLHHWRFNIGVTYTNLAMGILGSSPETSDEWDDGCSHSGIDGPVSCLRFAGRFMGYAGLGA